MAFGRRRPSLARTVARTAVISGTAAKTSQAVHGKAARQQAAVDLQVAQAQEAAALAQAANQAPAAAAPAPAAATDDLVARLERLAALHASGALSDDEFATLKAQLIS